MKCLKCGGESIQTSYGPWCNTCGGVMCSNGEPYVRHVATVKGAGGEYTIIYDYSISQYSFSYKRAIKLWVGTEEGGDWKQGIKTFTQNGSLDEMLSMAQPHAQGKGQELPELFTGTGANQEELAILNETSPFSEVKPQSDEETVTVENINIDK